MEGLWVSRPLFDKLAIALGLLSALAVSAQELRLLTQEQLLGDPAAVATWLRENASKADRKTAATFAKLGAKDKARGYWSAASKAYGQMPADCEPLKVYRAEFDRVSKKR